MLDLEELTAEEMYEAALPGTSFDDIVASLEWEGMGEGWEEQSSDENDARWNEDSSPLPPNEHPLLSELRTRLLSIGGESACFPSIEEDLRKILSRGILWDGANPEMMIGEPSQCHSNSAYCWNANRDKITIATGYALSSDGIWRQHSWCIGLDDENYGPYVIETTAERVCYYGFAMTYDECDMFYYENT